MVVCANPDPGLLMTILDGLSFTCDCPAAPEHVCDPVPKSSVAYFFVGNKTFHPAKVQEALSSQLDKKIIYKRLL